VSESRLVFDPPSVDVERVRREADVENPVVLPGHPPHVGYAGALVRARGLNVLAQAAAILDMRRAKATVVVAGSGPAARDLADDVSARRIHLIEDPKSVPAILAALDICVFPALEPGMPTTLLEAAVLGRPIVASDVPGVSDLFVDARQISIVPADDPKALAAAIARLLDEPSLAAEMAARAQRHALEHLSASASIERHRELYARLLAGDFGHADADAPDPAGEDRDTDNSGPVPDESSAEQGPS
jgi:glycosyltransferase involved in cell wall biosynthesis